MPGHLIRTVIHYKNLLVDLKGREEVVKIVLAKNMFIYRTLAQAMTTLSLQATRESEAHTCICDTLLNDISIPMKNLAEKQSKDRKLV
jgi:hypothetical protein